MRAASSWDLTHPAYSAVWSSVLCPARFCTVLKSTLPSRRVSVAGASVGVVDESLQRGLWDAHAVAEPHCWQRVRPDPPVDRVLANAQDGGAFLDCE
jgi:hypothetical protein